MKSSKPVIFWHSDPVGPDETVVISGGNFASDAHLELSIVTEETKKPKWLAVAPLQVGESSLKAVIPAEWQDGIYACRVRQGEETSQTVYLNAPDIWWKQGDEGVDRARQEGWLRVLGKCLDFGGAAWVALVKDHDTPLPLEMEEQSCFSLKAKLPHNIAPGMYRVVVSNGKGGKDGERDAGTLEVLPAKAPPKAVIDVTELGADPTGMKDCTLPITQAIERLSMVGGGVVYFPRGRYRVDSVLRSGTWIKSPLFIPEGITLQGEGTDLVSLWWPDMEKGKVLPTLIEGHNGFGLEALTIYVQGYHSTIITGASHVRIRNVCIRANYYYMTNTNGTPHHGRVMPPPDKDSVGPAILLWGENNQVTHCDILHLAIAFDIRVGRGNLIAHNTVRASNLHALNGTREMIFEHNENTGNSMAGRGNNIGLHMGASTAMHLYYAHNTSTHLYGGDHETLTFDGHAVAYVGKVGKITPDGFVLKGKTYKGDTTKGALWDMHDCVAYIVDGRGAGQYRWLAGYEGDSVRLEKEWDIPPDESSLLVIGGFNGRHILVGNTGIDSGALVQLYPPNIECIVSGNRGIRASNINSTGKIRVVEGQEFLRVEPSWYNQFLDNHIVVGNAWGGGRSKIDRWLGGECTLSIWGWQVYVAQSESGVKDLFLRPEHLQKTLGEKQPRANGIAISRFQIVRRHLIENNSSIRVQGTVSDVLIEGCDLRHSRKGIRIEQEVEYWLQKDIGQLFEFEPEPSEKNPALPFLSPQGVVVRNNRFRDVEIPYSGSALAEAVVIEPSGTTEGS